MSAPTSSTRHYVRLQRLQVLTLAAIRRAWGRMTPGGNWENQYARQVGPQIMAVVVAAQISATRESDSYIAEVLNELDFGPTTSPGVVVPTSLAGYMGDGREVSTLLATTVGRARALSANREPQQALDDAQAFMDMIVQTLLADSARNAELAAMAPRPWVNGWVRQISPPCCSRCAILSGKFYLFNEGFLRHPQCDCYHVPAPAKGPALDRLLEVNSPDRYFESLDEAEQDRIFTRAGAEAIREGADMSRVVNARRGMSVAQIGGRRVQITTAGARGVRNRGVRLMPESIFLIAESREDAIRLLIANGYITT